jgi:hypothetical protein
MFNHFKSVGERLRISVRGAAELLIIIGAFALGEPTPLSLLIGSCFCIAGELLRICVAGFGHSVGEIVLAGPYRYVRHPYFLGTGLLFIGIAVASRSAVITALAIALMVLSHRKYARRDEERLKKALGPEYGMYVATVPAIVPRLWPTTLRQSENARSRFSLGVAMFKGRHREIDSVISLALAFALFYLFYIFNYLEVLRLGAVLAVALYIIARTVFFGMRARA